MRPHHRALLGVAVLCCACAGAGGGPDGGGPDAGGADAGQRSLTLTPSSISLSTLATQAFTATLTGTQDQGLEWSVVQGLAGGRVDGLGSYRAPGAPGTYTVRVASAEDPSLTATATVTVTVGCLEAFPPVPRVTAASRVVVKGRVPVAVDAQGRPLVAWLEDGSPSAVAYVARLEDGGWRVLGSGLPTGSALDPGINVLDLALDAAGNPVLVHPEVDGAARYQVRVHRWTGTAWEAVGPLLGDPNVAFFVALALQPGGAPAVAHVDQTAVGTEVAVSRWSGSAWTTTASLVSHTPTNVANTALLAHPNGDLTVAWDEAFTPGVGMVRYAPFARTLLQGGGAGPLLVPPDGGVDLHQSAPALAFDGAGAVAMAWSDFPDATTGVTSLGLRVHTAPAWAPVGPLAPERSNTSGTPHGLVLHQALGRLAVATTVGELSTVGVHQASGGAWPLVCAPLYDAEQPDFVATQATSVGLAYDPLHQAYVMAAAIEPNRLVSPTLLVSRVSP